MAYELAFALKAGVSEINVEFNPKCIRRPRWRQLGPGR